MSSSIVLIICCTVPSGSLVRDCGTEFCLGTGIMQALIIIKDQNWIIVTTLDNLLTSG